MHTHEKKPLILSTRLPGLDFLRAFAALWVFVFHYMALAPDALKPLANSYYIIIGWNGVDLFFVLSGFLIGAILRRENENVKSFMIRRFFRIYPAYLLIVILCIAINKPYLFKDWLLVLSHLFLFNNLIPGYGGAVNGVLWTLGAEFQFYIIAALLLLLPRGKYVWWYLIAIMVIGSLLYRWVIFASVAPSERFFFSTQLPGMFGLFGMGFLAVQLKNIMGDFIKRFFPIFLVLAVGSLFVYCEWLQAHVIDYWESAEAVIFGRLFSGITFALIVLVFSCTSDYLGVMFKKSGLVFIGEISYGIYLTHLFLIDLLKPYESIFSQFNWALYASTLVALTFLCSCLIYFLVERPFIKLGARLSSPAVSK